MSINPEFYAGSALTAAALNSVVPQIQYVTANQLVNSTSAATVVSFPVQAGTYSLDGRIVWQQGATQAEQAMRILGPTASLIRATVIETAMSTTGEQVFAGTVTAYNTDLFGASGGQPATDVVLWDIDAVFTFSAAGTLTVQARCAVSNSDTYTIQAGSKVTLLQS